MKPSEYQAALAEAATNLSLSRRNVLDLYPEEFPHQAEKAAWKCTLLLAQLQVQQAERKISEVLESIELTTEEYYNVDVQGGGGPTLD